MIQLSKCLASRRNFLSHMIIASCIVYMYLQDIRVFINKTALLLDAFVKPHDDQIWKKKRNSRESVNSIPGSIGKVPKFTYLR